MSQHKPQETIAAIRALLSRSPDPDRWREEVAPLLDQLERACTAPIRGAPTADPSGHLASIGLLASGVAHDFNNLLTVIQMSAELIESLPEDSERRTSLLADIQLAASRGAALTTQILDFSRRTPSPSTSVEIGDLVETLQPMLDRLLGDDVSLRHEGAEGPLWVTSGAGLLEQVIINLAVNARDAMSGGGTIRLRVEKASDDTVLLQVIDTGHGMSPDVAARIFDPFFTTKGTDGGTGLGLANVQSIVERLGGRIEVDSVPNEGTAFSVLLPRSAPPDADPS